MDGNNQNNINHYIPQEIPIPGAEGPENPNNPYGQSGNPYHHNPYQADESGSSGMNNGWAGPPSPPQNNRKWSAAKIIIFAASVFVVILAIGLVAAGFLRSRPSYKIAKGMQNMALEMSQSKNPLLEKIGYGDLLVMMTEDGSYVNSSLNFSMDLPMIGNTTVGIDTETYKDMRAKEMNSNTSFSIMNYDFAHMDIYADEDVFCFSLPELFMEDMYIENENVVSQFNQSVLSEGGYVSEGEDFSIDLFPDSEGREKTALDVWRNLDAVNKRFEDDIKACRDGMKYEKVGKGLYRVTFPARETNRLIQNFAKSYEDVFGLKEDMELFMDYDEVVCSDISLLFEIGRRNRIESITLENPLEVLDKRGKVDLEFFFLGEKRSIDKIQGKISASAEEIAAREIIFQIEQPIEDQISRFDMDMKMTEDGSTVGKIKFKADSNGAQDDFNVAFSVRTEDDDLEVDIEGNIDDYVRGESVEVDLSKVTFLMDGEDIFRITGDITVQPLNDEVKRTVKAETAFFEMTLQDWFDIIDQLDDAYGGVLDYLW